MLVLNYFSIRFNTKKLFKYIYTILLIFALKNVLNVLLTIKNAVYLQQNKHVVGG